jgi:hypothetical protein
MHDKRIFAVGVGLFFIGIGLRGLATGVVLVRGTVSRKKEPRTFWFEIFVWIGGGASFLLAALLWL